jgi:hypothetical protein
MDKIREEFEKWCLDNGKFWNSKRDPSFNPSDLALWLAARESGYSAAKAGGGCMNIKPSPLELIPGLPAENARRFGVWAVEMAEYNASNAERFQKTKLEGLEKIEYE